MAINSPETDNQALRELRDEIKDLNKNLKSANKANSALAIVLLVVGILQLVVIAFQLSIGIYGPNWKGFLFGLFLELVSVMAVSYVVSKVAPKKN